MVESVEHELSLCGKKECVFEADYFYFVFFRRMTTEYHRERSDCGVLFLVRTIVKARIQRSIPMSCIE